MLQSAASAWLFPVWTRSFKTSNQGLGGAGGWRRGGGYGSQGVEEQELCIDPKRLLSTERNLLPRHVTPLLPGHVARALVKVILRAGGVSHDLKHVAFLSAKIKAAIFLCPGSPTQASLPLLAP